MSFLSQVAEGECNKILLRPHRAAADLKGGQEHRRQGSPSTFQSPGGGHRTVSAPAVPARRQEAEEQPVPERGAP